jgi:hypothetical protein
LANHEYYIAKNGDATRGGELITGAGSKNTAIYMLNSILKGRSKLRYYLRTKRQSLD